VSFWFSDDFWGEEGGPDLTPAEAQKQREEWEARSAQERADLETAMTTLRGLGAFADPSKVWVRWTTGKRRSLRVCRLDRIMGWKIMGVVVVGEKVHIAHLPAGIYNTRIRVLDLHRPSPEEERAAERWSL
jgi:hypothetical protein